MSCSMKAFRVEIKADFEEMDKFLAADLNNSEVNVPAKTENIL